jgi:hypothetical protein
MAIFFPPNINFTNIRGLFGQFGQAANSQATIPLIFGVTNAAPAIVSYPLINAFGNSPGISNMGASLDDLLNGGNVNLQQDAQTRRTNQRRTNQQSQSDFSNLFNFNVSNSSSKKSNVLSFSDLMNLYG